MQSLWIMNKEHKLHFKMVANLVGIEMVRRTGTFLHLFMSFISSVTVQVWLVPYIFLGGWMFCATLGTHWPLDTIFIIFIYYIYPSVWCFLRQWGSSSRKPQTKIGVHQESVDIFVFTDEFVCVTILQYIFLKHAPACYTPPPIDTGLRK